ncbi:MAG: DNA translocase FtsK 4TM domain-containing protein [Alloprevotella sp.]
MAKKKTATRKKGAPATPGTNGWRTFTEAFELKQILQGETIRFIIGFTIFIIAALVLLALVSNIFTGWQDQSKFDLGVATYGEDETPAANYGGTLGAVVAHYLMNDCFGLCAFFVPIFLIVLSMRLMSVSGVRLWKWFLNLSILTIWGSVSLSFLQEALQGIVSLEHVAFPLGGGHGDYIQRYLSVKIGKVGTLLVILITAVFYLIYITRETIRVLQGFFRWFIPKKKEQTADETGENDADDADTDDLDDDTEDFLGDTENYNGEKNFFNGDSENYLGDSSTAESNTIDLMAQPENPTPEENAEAPSEDALPPTEEAAASPDGQFEVTAGTQEAEAEGKTLAEVEALAPYDPRKDLENYHFPQLELLKHYDDTGTGIDMAEQTANKDRIITVLRNFGVEITGIKATVGPTITLYEITPAPGVRISKIRNLEDDIALNLSAIGVRIIAPIPGKGTIGIEVPNQNPHIVSMESILNSRKFEETKFDLPVALGKTITNEVFMVDLAKMPHLLVAGATGQGKSVGLNALITSLLYKKHPAELKFVMVDPKKVEFSMYSPIENHFLAKLPEEDEPIITDVDRVVRTLKSLCQLMDHRYDLLKRARCKNIKEYNAKFTSRQLNPDNGHEYMPYIVIIIDEFGDLIMTAGKEVELPIARIAQLARAVGMHMVIATQRPTTNIITGTIKANFPARMAFKVMSQIDSRTILDRGGANQLVGRGDMLFLAAGEPVRVQCAFVDTPEVERINGFISTQQSYLHAYELPEPLDEGSDASGGGMELDSGSLDPMFGEAARLIVIHQQGSTSLIQRKFSIGYNRAGRLMDQLEKAGIVGPVRGSKPREVLVQDELQLEQILNAL